MKPINCRDDEVRGFLDGTRRMLVRPVLVRNVSTAIRGLGGSKREMRDHMNAAANLSSVDLSDSALLALSPFGSPGDRLWVREAFCGGQHGTPFLYRASWQQNDFMRWRPSTHMTQEASRLTLTTKSVRVVRVQEISEEDIIADGYEWDFGVPARGLFEEDWNKNNGKSYPWDSNPWAWLGEVTAALADGGD